MSSKHVADPAQADEVVRSNDSRFEAFTEPDFEATSFPIISEHIWTNSHFKHAIVPFDDLPRPSGDRTRINPCTVRFQFTGPFKATDQAQAKNSLAVQLKGIFARFGDRSMPLWFRVTFPAGVGRGKFVDIATSPLDLDKLKCVSLTYKKHKLELIVVGPRLPHNTRVLEVINVPANLSARAAAQNIAFQIQAREAGQVLDVWQITTAVAPEVAEIVAAGQYDLVVALLPPELSNGDVPANLLTTIPGYIKFNEEHCMVSVQNSNVLNAKAEVTRRTDARKSNSVAKNKVPRRRRKKRGDRNGPHRHPNRVLLAVAGLLTVASWNCASLQINDRQHFLHNRSTFMGTADIVLLQEIRSIFHHENHTNNGLLRPHAAYNPRPHISLFAYDTGILIRHTDWLVEEVHHTSRSTYARIRIPESSPAIGAGVRVLHIWSIHAPPQWNEFREFWQNDVAGLGRLHDNPLGCDSAAIVGGDWNSVPCRYTDVYPANTPTIVLPSDPFDVAQLCDAFRVLHPGRALFTRHHIVQGTLLSARRLDSIWISRSLLPSLTSAQSKPSPSDHAAVSLVLTTSAAAETRGPGTWRLHRDVHLRPGFAERLQTYMAQYCKNLSIRTDPIVAWTDLKERTRATSFNLSVEISGLLHAQEQHRLEVLSSIERIDIRAGENERHALAASLRQLKRLEVDLALAAADLFTSRHDHNMFQPTSWIIPRLESRSFAPMPDIREGDNVLTSVVDKVAAVERFYRDLFTPQPWNHESQSAANTLLRRTVRRISPRTRESLERPFTVTELQDAFRHRKDASAPGLDGFSYPILRLLGPDFLDKLCRAANSLMAGNSLPAGFPSLRGVLLPKTGDLSRLSNYRPLSIADTDIRLLGASTANRLQAAAQEVVPPTQTGFILHRQSAFNVVALYLIQHAIQAGKIDTPIWVLNLDQQKAFDRVRHEWLDLVLQHYGFGERFRTYVREIYRHPSLRQTVEGHLTDPIPLRCGLLQGDPMSCLLFNLSLQPLLDFVVRQGSGVTLPWDETQTAKVSSLAFADDILILVQSREDIRRFEAALELYETASNARLNKDKSQAFAFRPPSMAAGSDSNHGIRDEDIPFPILGHNHKEIVHLGYPIRLDGGTPDETIAKLLQSIKTKVDLLSSGSSSTLLGRVQICNTFLTSKLWHALRICPLPVYLDRKVRDLLQPFLFKGRRNWLRANIVSSPRHIGGLGLIDTLDMADCLFGQVLVSLLTTNEPIGSHFRHALHHHLWTEYEAIPAHFILRSGLPWQRMNNRMLAQRSFLSRAVFTLARLRLDVSITDWTEPTLDEALALPWYSDMYGYKWREVSADATQAWERNGIRTWADILWYNGLTQGLREHPHAVSGPLVPPSASGVKTNYVERPGWPSHYLPFSRASGLVLHKQWNQMWETIPIPLRRKLLSLPRHYQPHPDHSDSRLNPRPHDRPFNINTNKLHFPWRFATLAGAPLAEYTVRRARAFLAPSEIIMPDWSFNSNVDDWKGVWRRFNEASLLSLEALSDVYLFLHRRPWLAQKPRLPPTLPILETDEIQGSDDQPPDAADAFHAEYCVGVTRCMACLSHDIKDSAAHGFVECPVVQAKVWTACQPVLRQLVGLTGAEAFPTDLRNIIFTWRQGTQHSRSLTARVCLWRNTIIHLLTRRRHEAIAEGCNVNRDPVLNLDHFAAQATTKIASLIILSYAQTSDKQAFFRKWVLHGLLFQVVGGDLVVVNLRERAAH